MRRPACCAILLALAACETEARLAKIEDDLDFIHRVIDVNELTVVNTKSGVMGDANKCEIDVEVENFPTFTVGYDFETGSGGATVEMGIKNQSDVLEIKRSAGDLKLMDLGTGLAHAVYVFDLDGTGSDASIQIIRIEGGMPDGPYDVDATNYDDTKPAYSGVEVTVRTEQQGGADVVIVRVYKDGEATEFTLGKP